MYLLVFSSRSAALRVKARLDAAGIYSRAVGTPSKLSKSCGISLEVYGAPYSVVAPLAEGAAAYRRTQSGWELLGAY